jgi:hypothetical protein
VAHHPGDEAPQIRGNLIDVAKRVGEIRRRFADHRYRYVSESWVLREYGDARGESIANDASPLTLLTQSGHFSIAYLSYARKVRGGWPDGGTPNRSLVNNRHNNAICGVRGRCADGQSCSRSGRRRQTARSVW